MEQKNSNEMYEYDLDNIRYLYEKIFEIVSGLSIQTELRIRRNSLTILTDDLICIDEINKLDNIFNQKGYIKYSVDKLKIVYDL